MMLGRMVISLLLGLALLAPWHPAPARAHAHFVEATPGPGAVLATPPPRLQILFDEEFADEGSRLQVFGPRGQRADRRDQQVSGRRLWISLQDLGPGPYRVRWKAVAEDDKGETRGEYTFTVQPSLPAGAPRIAVSPAQAGAGQPVTLAGSGFAPDQNVVLSVGDGEELLALARADQGGRFSAQVALPDDLPFGRQVIQAADAADHLATAAVFVPSGGWPAAIVQLGGEAQPDAVEYTLRVENRSGFHLSNLVLRADVPPGTQVLAEGLAQPDGVDAAKLEEGRLVWRLRALAPHAIAGPFTFQVATAGLSGRPQLAATASLDYAHATPPLFRGTAQSAEARVQVSSR
jgi:methionine-rich copper-binding protein CopC